MAEKKWFLAPIKNLLQGKKDNKVQSATDDWRPDCLKREKGVLISRIIVPLCLAGGYCAFLQFPKMFTVDRHTTQPR
jgi:hypothetical protein